MPSGGCTTKLPVEVNTSVSPARKLSFAPSGQVALVAEPPQRPRILDVVRLVERFNVVRVPQIPEPQDAGQQRDEGRDRASRTGGRAVDRRSHARAHRS